MESSKHTVGFVGIGIGAIALLVASVHLWAGPFSPQPSIENTVAEQAVAIRNATIAALKGEKLEEMVRSDKIDPDRGLQVAAGIMGGLAIILGVVRIARRESMRVASDAAFFGGAAIAFFSLSYSP